MSGHAEGVIVLVDEVDRAGFALTRTVRDNLQNIPDRLAEQLAVETDPTRARSGLAEEIRRALVSLTGLRSNPNPHKTKSEPVLSFDPWAGCADPRFLRPNVREVMLPSELAPGRWFALPAPARARLAGLAVRVLADHPSASQAQQVGRLRSVLSATHNPDAGLAMGGDERAYAEPFLEADADERAAWRATDHALQDTDVGPSLIDELIAKLRGVGSIEAALTRRDAIDEQLERLAKLRGAPTPGKAVAR